MTKPTIEGKAPANWPAVVETFAVHLSDGEKSRHTIRGYTSDLRLFESWYWGTYQERPSSGR